MSVASNIDKLKTSKIGAVGSGNYSEFEADGTLKFNGDATVWDDLLVNLSNATGTGLQPASNKEYMDSTGFPGASLGSSGVYLPHFATAQEEDLSWNLQMPHSWKVGNIVKPHIHWVYKTDSTGDIRWGVEFGVASINGNYKTTCPASTHRESAGTTKKIWFATDPLVRVYQQIVVSGAGGTGYTGDNSANNATFTVLSWGVTLGEYWITYIGSASSTEAKTADTGKVVTGYTYRMEVQETQAANNAGKHVMSGFGDLEMDKFGISCCFVGRLYRVKNSGVSGGLNEEAVANSFDFHFEKDTIGSRGVTSK